MPGENAAKIGVQISDKRRSIRYVESSIQEDEGSLRVRRRSSEEFVRLQATADDQWARKYYYVLCCILIGTGHDCFPVAMELVIKLSGGGLMLLLIIFSLILGLPMMYMEVFLGRYTKLTNCQMYRMAPLCFGFCLAVFVVNALYQPMHVTIAAQLMVNLLKLLANPDMNTKCLDEDGECYDYVKKGKLNDTCRYGFISMICEKHGEVRYLMEYQYWKVYRDPTSPEFPYYQIITGVVITWICILVIIVKKLQVLGWTAHVAFLIQMSTLTMIFFLALAKEGGTNGLNALVKVNFEQFDAFYVLVVQWYSVSRLGLIIPSGYMTFSAYANFDSNIGGECCIIVVCSLLLTGYYLAVYFAVCGVLAEAMGVAVEAVIIPDKGLYLAVVPQFLVQLKMPNIFLVIYYGALWLTETIKVAFYVHMLILNLYDYFPNLKNFATYIWVTSCLFLCLFSIPMSEQFANTVYIPVLWGLYIMIGIGVSTTMEATMVSYLYGVNRLCDDIHHATGHRPMLFYPIMWYFIPFLGWCSVLFMATIIKSTFVADEKDVTVDLETGWLYAVLSAWASLCLIVISTLMYVAFRFGHPQLLLSLIKPQYFWGPSGRDYRIDRKNFCPRSNIRSQEFHSRMKQETDHFDTIQQDGILVSDFSRDVLNEQSGSGDILKDKLFFEHIGLFSHMRTGAIWRYTEVKEREIDL